MATLLGRTVQDTAGVRPPRTLDDQTSTRNWGTGGLGGAQPAPHQRRLAAPTRGRAPHRVDLRPGASSVWAEPWPLVKRVRRHRKYHRCTRFAAPVPPSQLILMQGASFWGTAGMPRVVGPPHGRRPAQYDLCPGWTPDPGHCGGSAPRSQPSRQPQSRPRARPSGALQVWTRVGEGPQRRRTPNTISAPDGPPTRGIGGIAPACCSRLPAARPVRGASSWGTAGRGGRTRVHRRRARSIRSLPQMARSTRGTAGILRRSRLPSPPQYDLCPRWPHHPGALRVSSRHSHLL